MTLENDALWEGVISALLHRDFDTAIKTLTRIVEHGPSDGLGNALVARGMAHLQHLPPDHAAAKSDCQRALDLDAKNLIALETLVQAMVAANDPFNDVAGHLTNMTKIEPTRSESWTTMALVFVSYEKYDLAVEAATNAINRDPLNYLSFETRAYSYLMLDDTIKCKADLWHLFYLAPNWREHPPAWASEAVNDQVKLHPGLPNPVHHFMQVNEAAPFAKQSDLNWIESRFFNNLSHEGIRLQGRLDDRTQDIPLICSRHLNQTTSILNVLLSECKDNRPPKGIYCFVAHEEPRGGLAGCFIDECARDSGRWQAVVPSSLLLFLNLLCVLLDNHCPAARGYVVREDACDRYSEKHFSKRLSIYPKLELNETRNDSEAWHEFWNAMTPKSGEWSITDLTGRATPPNVRARLLNTYIEPLKKFRDAEILRAASIPYFVTDFLIAHEVHHVLAKHSEAKRFYSDSDIKAYVWCSELQADEWAYLFLLEELLKRYNIEDAHFRAATTVFTVMSVVGLQELQTDGATSDSMLYPPVSVRVQRLREITLQTSGTEAFTWDYAAMEFMERMNALSETLNWPELGEVAGSQMFLEDPAEHSQFYQENASRFDRLCRDIGGLKLVWSWADQLRVLTLVPI